MEYQYILEARTEYNRLAFDDSKVSQGMAIAEALTSIVEELETLNGILSMLIKDKDNEGN